MLREKIEILFEIGMIVAVAAALVLLANYYMRPYDAKADKVYKTLYSQDADMEETEVAFLGGSHAVNGFNPNIVWKEKHIKSYNFSFSGSPLYLNEYYLKELLKKRDFKLVVLDLYYIGMNEEFFSYDNYVFSLVEKMRWDDERYSFIRNHVSPDNRARYYIPGLTYRTRWSEWSKNDVERRPNPEDDYLLGNDFQYGVADEAIVFEPWEEINEVAAIPFNTEKYLRDIIEMVKESGSEILLVDLPHKYDTGAPGPWVESERAVMNRAKEIASGYQINMIQFDDKLLADIGFDSGTDMYNKGHMNIDGSEKVSAYLAGYIQENYPAVKRYESSDVWDGYYEKYRMIQHPESD